MWNGYGVLTKVNYRDNFWVPILARPGIVPDLETAKELARLWEKNPNVQSVELTKWEDGLIVEQGIDFSDE